MSHFTWPQLIVLAVALLLAAWVVTNNHDAPAKIEKAAVEKLSDEQKREQTELCHSNGMKAGYRLQDGEAMETFCFLPVSQIGRLKPEGVKKCYEEENSFRMKEVACAVATP